MTQNIRVTAFTISELFSENQQVRGGGGGEGGGKINLAPRQIKVNQMEHVAGKKMAMAKRQEYKKRNRITDYGSARTGH